MPRPALPYWRSPPIFDRATVDRILFFLAIAVILAVTAAPSLWASGMPVIAQR